ncbi:MAG: class I SAM-dependent methyltransferase [Pseudonocardiaceae bacterium]
MSDIAPSTSCHGLDAASWVHRWDRQQAGYVPDREQIFALMLDVLARLGAAPGRLLDLACGPGSLSDRTLARFPDAEVFGLDLDPVMLELGRRTLGDRVHWVETDLRAADWTGSLPTTPFDAIASATALHWLDADHLPHLAAGLAALVRPGGVFLNFDTLLADPADPRLAELTKQLRQAAHEQQTNETLEDFYAWWESLAEEPELSEFFVERDRRFGSRRHGAGTTLVQWERVLRTAGFAEVATLTQMMDRRLLVAIR